jgi:hypothetical protein
MSRERERYRIGRRISIYREWRMWMLDASFPNGNRLRCSLKTQEEPEAFKRAHLFLLEFSKVYREAPLSWQNDLLWDSIKQEITSEDLELAVLVFSIEQAHDFVKRTGIGKPKLDHGKKRHE